MLEVCGILLKDSRDHRNGKAADHIVDVPFFGDFFGRHQPADNRGTCKCFVLLFGIIVQKANDLEAVITVG